MRRSIARLDLVGSLGNINNSWGKSTPAPLLRRLLYRQIFIDENVWQSKRLFPRGLGMPFGVHVTVGMQVGGTRSVGSRALLYIYQWYRLHREKREQCSNRSNLGMRHSTRSILPAEVGRGKGAGSGCDARRLHPSLLLRAHISRVILQTSA